MRRLINRTQTREDKPKAYYVDGVNENEAEIQVLLGKVGLTYQASM